MNKLKALLAAYFASYEYLAVAKGHGKPSVTTDELAEAMVDGAVERLQAPATDAPPAETAPAATVDRQPKKPKAPKAEKPE